MSNALAETYLTEFYDLHDLNAKRVRLVNEVERLASEAGDDESGSELRATLSALAAEHAYGKISRTFRYRTTSELAQIYRKDGLLEARNMLLEMVSQEDDCPLADQSPCCRYNLAYVYHLMSRASGIDPRAARELTDKALALLSAARAILAERGNADRSADQCVCPSEARTLMALTHNLAAMIYLSRSQDERCRQELKKAIQCDATLPDASFTKGVYHMQHQEFDAAILELCKAVQSFLGRGEEIADVWFQMGRVYMKKADRLAANGDPYAERLYEEAASCLVHAAEVDPAFALPHYKLGLLELRKSRCEVAIEHFQRVLSNDDSFSETLGQVTCPGNCCKGGRLKIMLLDLLGRHKANERVSTGSPGTE